MQWWTVQQLRSKNPATRQQAISKLAAEGSAQSVAALIQAVEDPLADVRKAAIRALGRLREGSALSALVSALRDPDAEVREEEGSARQELVQAASRRIDQLYEVWPGHRPLLDRLRDTYRDRSEHVERQRDPATDGEDRELIEHREIRRTVIDSEREALLRLRAEGAIDDDVMRSLERELDLEEQRMDA